MVKSDGLRKWFSRNKGKGWVNCKTGGACGRKSRKSVGSYPACRAAMAQCKSAKGKAAPPKKNIKEGELEKMSDLAEKQSQIWVRSVNLSMVKVLLLFLF